MSDIDFHWTYTGGDNTIDMGYMNVETIRNMLLGPAKVFGGLTFTKFKPLFDGYSYGESMMGAEDVFRDIANGNDVLTVENILNFTRDQLKAFGRAFDPPHGPQTKSPEEEIYFLPGESSEHELDEEKSEEADNIREKFKQEVEDMELKAEQVKDEL